MNFVPLPQNLIHEPIEIPCLATEDYDDGDFGEYPNRKGWGKRPVQEWHAIFKARPAEFLAFLQTWLYFGLIAMVFGEHISIQTFTKKGLSGRVVIDASKLKEWFIRRPILQPRSYEEKIRIGNTIHRTIRMHCELHFVHYMTDYPDREPMLQDFIATTCLNDPRDPETIAATSLLLEALFEYTFIDTVARENPGIKGLIGGSSSIGTPFNFLFRKMRGTGWCPSELAVMFKRLNTAGLYFMHHMKRPHAHRQHKMIRIHPPSLLHNSATASSAISGTHRSSSNDLCNMEKCSFLQLNDETYQTKHADGCSGSNCYDMIGDPQDVLEILRSGSIPLILSVDGNDKNDTLTLVSSGPDFEYSYVAISHVWSDGLGNVQRSALPRCQILRLSKLIRSLTGKASGILLFWVDTIGCPPDVASQNEAQELAIGMMRQTYENATAVLVLDAWLQIQKINLLPHHEILMMIVCSTWNSRLWTLQEGVLAKILFFQFSDGVYDIDQGLASLHNCTDPVLRITLMPTISNRVYEIRRYARIESALGPKLNALRAALCHRFTSVETDEALCLAALLNLDKAKFTAVIQAPPKDRMRTFWSLLENIPLVVLFDSHPRLEIDGYRWAPRTFLRHPQNFVTGSSVERLLQSPLAKNTPTGLLFQRAGLIMATGQKPIGSYFHARDEDDIIYRLNCHVDELEKAVNYDITHKYSSSWPTDYDVKDFTADGHIYERKADLYELYGTQVLCFIFENDFRRKSLELGSGLSRGVFTSLEYKYNGVVHVRYLFSGTCRILRTGVNDGELGQLPQVPVQRASRDHGGHGEVILPTGVAIDRFGMLRLVGARVFDEEQYWCVG
jgi:hypothetical protein